MTTSPAPEAPCRARGDVHGLTEVIQDPVGGDHVAGAGEDPDLEQGSRRVAVFRRGMPEMLGAWRRRRPSASRSSTKAAITASPMVLTMVPRRAAMIAVKTSKCSCTTLNALGVADVVVERGRVGQVGEHQRHARDAQRDPWSQ